MLIKVWGCLPAETSYDKLRSDILLAVLEVRRKFDLKGMLLPTTVFPSSYASEGIVVEVTAPSLAHESILRSLDRDLRETVHKMFPEDPIPECFINGKKFF